jgi:predicted Holliday junction resolvase-like endonuclease
MLLEEEEDDVNEYVTKEIIDEIDSWLEKSAGVTILHLNIRSLNKNWNELEVVLDSQLGIFDVLALSEISVHDHEIKYELEGYNSYYKRRAGKRGGGLALFVKESIRFIPSPVDFYLFEGISGSIILENKIQLYLLVVYRPPHGSKTRFVNELEDIIVKVADENVVILGDINLDLKQDSDKVVQEYQNVLSSNGFISCITGITREEYRADKLSSSCIDHMFVRSKASDLRSAIFRSKISDHYMILMDIMFQSKIVKDINKKSHITKTLYDENKLKKLLRECDWNDLLDEKTSNGIFDGIECKITKCYKITQRSKVVKKGQARKDKEWITEEIKRLIKVRDKAFRKWKHCSNSLKAVFRDDYVKIRNFTNKKIKDQRSHFYQGEIVRSQGNIKETWQVINDIIGRKKKVSVDECIKRYLGKTSSLDEIVESFVESFVNGVQQILHVCDIQTLQYQASNHNQQSQSMFMQPAKVQEIKSMIESLDETKPPGLDGIRIKDIKKVAEQLSPILTHLINVSITTGVFPAKLKTAIVRPIYKKGDHLNYSNYRPIALLPSIDKLMERHVAKKLNAYLKKYKIINSMQFGFQEGKSTSDLLVQFSDLINEKLNDNMHILSLFIDFSKAFDTINHNKLKVALEKIGIRGPLLQWFESYLSERKVLVRVEDVYSKVRLCPTGVPQGSILGPILYIIYVNDMFNIVRKCKIYMYADDTVLVACHKNLTIAESQLQEDFTGVLQWTHDNSLVINADKTKLIHICSNLNLNHSSPVTIIYHTQNCLHEMCTGSKCKNCSDIIQNVDSHVYLGLTIDNRFSWKPHIDHLCRRLRSCAFQLYLLKNIVHFKIMKSVYSVV